MSVFLNPSATPPGAQGQAAPQVAPPPHKAGLSKKWLAFALIIVVAAGMYLLQPRQNQRVAQAPAIRTAKVTRGTLRQIVRVAGVTSARNFANITAPRLRGPDLGRGLVLTYLAEAGTHVKKGDLIVQFDAQAMKDHVDDVNATAEQAEADIRKRKAEQAIEEETLRQNLREAKAVLDKARLDYSAQEIRMPIDQELLKLAIDEAESQYKELQTDFKTAQVSNAAEIRILELTRDRHIKHRDRHIHDVERCTMRAPMFGLAVMQTIWRGGQSAQVQNGDQVYPGQPFMKIVDTSSMQVEARFNQADSERLRIGQRAEVNFDAFPNLHLNGRVYSIGALATGSWRQNEYIREIPVVIDIEGDDPRVIPDLSASADIVLDQQENTLSVPLEAVQSQAGKSIVYVKDGDRFQAKEVQIGMRNATRAAIVDGLAVGEEVALQKPTFVKQ